MQNLQKRSEVWVDSYSPTLTCADYRGIFNRLTPTGIREMLRPMIETERLGPLFVRLAWHDAG